MRLATEITKREGGKRSISVAQVTEVLRILADLLVEQPEATAAALERLARRAEKRRRRR